MGKEHKGEPKLGFSPETIDLLKQLSGQENTHPLLTRLQEIELRGAAGFLNLAHIGIQRRDFRDKGNGRRDQGDLERQLGARSIAVEIFFPELFPRRGRPPQVLAYEEAALIHKRVSSFRNALYAIVGGQTLPPLDRLLLPQIVECFDKIRQKEQKLPV